MDKLITIIEDLPELQQSRIKERLQELNQKALLLLDQMPDDFENYIEKALKECNDTMREMILKSTDEYNDKGALSYIYILHKERKKDLERLKEKALNGKQQPQSLNPEPQQILTINNSTKERMVFGSALKKEYMELINGCYKWKKTKSLLAYMCGRLYCGDRVKVDESDYSEELKKGKNQLPRQALQQLFNIDVGNNRDQLKAPPRNYYLIDDLFKG